ncbi:MAG: hypothetical protein COA78_38430 [Blastopirellula sp.]|nr:MAG: hypothetical protein COA78_38430 [Blastopirellula sp.]
MKVMGKGRAKKLSNNDLNTFGGRLRDAREEAGLQGTHVCNILNGYLQASGLAPVHIDTFRSWDTIGTNKEKLKDKSYPHPNVYNVLGTIYGVTGYWLFLGGKVERYRKNVTSPASIDYELEQRSALTPEAKEYQRVEIKFRKLLWGVSAKQKQAIERLIDSMLDEDD